MHISWHQVLFHSFYHFFSCSYRNHWKNQKDWINPIQIKVIHNICAIDANHSDDIAAFQDADKIKVSLIYVPQKNLLSWIVLDGNWKIYGNHFEFFIIEKVQKNLCFIQLNIYTHDFDNLLAWSDAELLWVFDEMS